MDWGLKNSSIAWYHTQYGTPPPTAAPVYDDDDPYYYDDYYYPPEAYEDSFHAVTEFAVTGGADLGNFRLRWVWRSDGLLQPRFHLARLPRLRC